MIVVYGATGFTGSLIAKRLVDLGATTVIAGRSVERLEELAADLGGIEYSTAPVDDSNALEALLAPATVVVNCAGPFLRLGEPVVKAAIATGTHYLDTTGEQAFVRDIYERYESAARRANVSVTNACAFEVAIGDWAAALAALAVGGSPIDEIAIAYAVSGFQTSRGTQLSIVESLAAPGCVWQHDRWDSTVPMSDSRQFRFPDPLGSRRALSFPSAEVATVPRHVDTHRCQTYIALTEDTPITRAAARLAPLLGLALPLLARSPLADLARNFTSTTATEENRSSAHFSILAEASHAFRRSRVIVSGSDVYGLTAEIATMAAMHLLGGDHLPVGVLAPAQLLDPRRSLAELVERCGISVEEE